LKNALNRCSTPKIRGPGPDLAAERHVPGRCAGGICRQYRTLPARRPCAVGPIHHACAHPLLQALTYLSCPATSALSHPASLN